MANLIVTIDGPAASGKSTVARLLAERLGASFLDTGAMYRAVTLAAMQACINMTNQRKLLDILNKKKFQFTLTCSGLRTYIDGVDVSEQIRTPEITANAHYIASSAKMRERMVEMQRQFAGGCDKIVTEGRDQGTVAFPNANIKFYLTAAPAERARRRAKDEGRTTQNEIKQIQRDLEERDASDQNRTIGPLTPPADAIVIDTTDLSVEEAVEKLWKIVTGNLKLVNGNHQSPITNYQLPKMRWFRLARWFCKVFCETTFRLHPDGHENVPDQGPLVLICNHQSFLDPVLCGIFVKRPLYFLTRDTLFHGLFGRLIASVNTIPVKRDAADVGAMKTIIRKLNEGNGVCLFPEGTRTSDGKITPFKPGLGLLCRRGNAVIVPVLVEGAFEAWPRHKKLFSPGKHITVKYGKAILAAEVKKISNKKLAKFLTDTLRQMQNDCRLKQSKEPYNYE
jgi:cytidylate kinase